MKELFMPFSKGTRNCIGQPMALFDLRLIAAAIARKYSVTVDGSMKEGDMDITDHFVLIPKGEKCFLRWTLAD
jgi:cytochrome P450